MPDIIATFDTGTDGWTIAGDVASFGWVATGGNPGGHLHWVDAVTGAISYYVASADFLGDQSAYYGGSLSYDIDDTGSDLGGVPDVELVGNGLTLGLHGRPGRDDLDPLRRPTHRSRMDGEWHQRRRNRAADAACARKPHRADDPGRIRRRLRNRDLDNVDLAAACYCPGTLIATPSGPQPIETLAAGDLVLTADGASEAVRWIGRRSYDGRLIAENPLMLPVTIRAGALADHIPHADLTVSPGHAMFVDGQLVPAWRLVNGVTITQAAAVDIVHYLHLELPRHALLLANGALAESFLDIAGFRSQFHDATARPGPAPSQSRLEDGFALQAIQARLRQRAGAAPAAEPNGALIGYVDDAAPGHVCGWAQDSVSPETPVALEIIAGDRPVLCVLANAYRADLRRAGLGSGCHAFETALPLGLEGPITFAAQRTVRRWRIPRLRRRWRRKPTHCSPHKPAGTAPRSPPYPAPSGCSPGCRTPKPAPPSPPSPPPRPPHSIP